MAEVVIPEIKHEYIRQVDTETTKDDWFDECIADNKEAAWAGIGTGELDSQYQPSPVKEPDYYMQYCSSDDYDYLKDYRLIWGYGIGIIEQDVICSLSTGEHLAEGKDACDTYATENAAGENIDWKRGTWIKFSGNRNVSPTRVGEVILPERVISLKDLCTALNPTETIIIEGFNIENVINIDNLFYNTVYKESAFKINNNVIFNFSNCKTAKKSFYQTNICNDNISFINMTENCCYDYMFQRATMNTIPTDFFNTENIGGIGMFYNSRINETVDNINNMKLYSYMFCNDDAHGVLNTIHFGSNCNFISCDSDITRAFYGTYMYDNIFVNYNNARTFDYFLYNVTFLKDDAITIDLSSIQNIESASHLFSNQTLRAITTHFIIIAPTCKFKSSRVFNFNLCYVNIVNTLYYYDLSDVRNLDLSINSNSNEDITTILGFIDPNQTCITGTIQGIGLFIGYNLIYENNKSNITIKNEQLSETEYVSLLRYLSRQTFIPYLIYSNARYTSTNTIIGEQISQYMECLNLDDYFLVTNLYKQKTSNSKHNINTENVTTINVNKNGKIFAILYPTNPNVNINIETNNNTKIFYTTCFASSLPEISYSDLYTYKYNAVILNLNNVDNDYSYIYYVEDYKTSIPNVINYYGGIIINAPQYSIINYEDESYDEDVDRYTNYIFCIDEINNIDLKKFCKLGNSCCNIYIKNSGSVDIGNKNITSSYSGHDVKFLINSAVTIHTYYIEDTYNLPVFVAAELSIMNDDNRNFPNIIDTNNQYAYCYIKEINNCNSINISQLLKFGRTITNNKIKNLYIDWDYDVIWDLNNYDVIKDDTEPPLTFLRFNTPNDYNLNINHTTKINGLVVGNATEILNNSINKLQLGNIFNNNSHTFLNLYCLNDFIELNCELLPNVNFYNCTNLKNITITNTNDDATKIMSLVLDNTCINIESIIIDNYNNCTKIDVSICSKLTQESINSIVNSTLYQSGATLTINTIPFQYITEEQKQALTDAGVTLVEYIPTETTE